jgi:drug/metabolite transporter (DMT)-like permease
MKKRIFASLLLLLNTILWATYYAVAKEALHRIDPIIFSFLELSSIAPIALCLLLITRKQLTKDLWLRGSKLGVWLWLTVFTSIIALKYTSATNTAFFPSLNGFLAALIAWGVLRQSIAKGTWLAGAISVGGALFMIFDGSGGGTGGIGDGVAFLSAIFYTCYVFQVDHETGSGDVSRLPLFAIELLIMAVLATIAAFVLGDWHIFHPVLPKDIVLVGYIGLMTTFLPTIIATFMQRYVPPVTVNFIYVMEPVWSALAAVIYLGEVLPLRGYIGGAFILMGALLNTWIALRSANHHERPPQTQKDLSVQSVNHLD